MSHWRAREPALTNARTHTHTHIREYIPFMVPQCRPLGLPSCVYCTAFCSTRVNVCVTRDDPWSRACMRARMRARKALPNVRNWWNAVPGQPTNTVGTVAWNEGHLGALTVKNRLLDDEGRTQSDDDSNPLFFPPPESTFGHSEFLYRFLGSCVLARRWILKLSPSRLFYGNSIRE